MGMTFTTSQGYGFYLPEENQEILLQYFVAHPPEKEATFYDPEGDISLPDYIPQITNFLVEAHSNGYIEWSGNSYAFFAASTMITKYDFNFNPIKIIAPQEQEIQALKQIMEWANYKTELAHIISSWAG
jgi:hypothetical protein